MPAVSTPSPAPGDFLADMLAVADRLGVRAEFEELALRWRGERVYFKSRAISVPRSARAVQLARKLMAEPTGHQVDARAIAAIVAERFGLSQRHARRLVRTAEADMLWQTVSVSGGTMDP